MHIFISYAKIDSYQLAVELRDTLQSLDGITAWMDEDLEPAESWASQIQNEINRCDYMIVLLSPDVNRKESRRSFVLNEIDYAQQIDKPIIPIMAQQTIMPVQIAGIQYIDFTANSELGTERLLRRVGWHVSVKKPPPTSRNEPRKRVEPQASHKPQENVARQKVVEKPRTTSSSSTMSKWILGIVGVVIFVIGFNLLREPDNQDSYVPPSPTVTKISVPPSPTPTATDIPPSPIPTDTPMPIDVDTGSEDYTIQLVPDMVSGVLIRFFYGDQPRINEPLRIFHLEENVVGDFFCSREVTNAAGKLLDINGEIYLELETGWYGAFEGSIGGKMNNGYYGIDFPDERGCPSSRASDTGIPFEVQADTKTILDIHLSQVEIGIVVDGEARSRVSVDLLDMEGNLLGGAWTDDGGLATIFTGTGDYIVEIDEGSNPQFEITVPPATTMREIYTIDSN